jgi:hypothetical protein
MRDEYDVENLLHDRSEYVDVMSCHGRSSGTRSIAVLGILHSSVF